MSVSWDRAHRRYELVNAVLGDVAWTGTPEISESRRAEIDREYGEFGEFLADVQRRWYRTFDARLDAVLEDADSDGDALAGATAVLWRQVAVDLWPTCVLLNAHAGHASIAPIEAHHAERLFAVTGFDHRLYRVDSPQRTVRRRVLPMCRLSRWRTASA
ncbi:hypothetical protein EV193_114152 [Herbihabitans rhizosphaerae]|uniref:Uncharacterized protein n=1 Tax=Herbihabitans rhizosphaerae TaxID=1872711 RepID=A0A4Q7KD39_9PSEU|nr:hypothetical protein [Herbihabitans rhizosphaerae]RZS31459.1 hypothetical protein EV193_114152 [Herbihabitans rhizosphaerae]